MAISPDALFQQIRPLCVGALQDERWDVKIGYLSNLKQRLCAPDMSATTLVELSEYICFPLLMLMKHPQSTQRVTEAALEVIVAVTQQCELESEGLLQDLLITLTLIINGQPKGAAEETKEVAVRACLQLLRPLLQHDNTTSTKSLNLIEILMMGPLQDDVLDEEQLDPTSSNTERHRLQLAHLISGLLDVTSESRILPLRQNALIILKRLAEITLIDADTMPIPNMKRLSNFRRTLGTIAPGVISALSKALLHDPKEHRTVMVGVLDALSAWLQAILGDDIALRSTRSIQAPTNSDVFQGLADRIHAAMNSTSTTESNQELQQRNGSLRNGESALPFSSEWIKATATNSNRALERIIPAITLSPHSVVRLALVRLCGILLKECAYTMTDSARMLLDTLLGRLQDEDPQVVQAAQLRISEIISAESNSKWLDILQESTKKLLLALPRQLLSPIADAEKLSHLQRILGYISVLGLHLDEIILDALQRCGLGLLRALTLRRQDVRVVEDRTPLLIDHEQATQQIVMFPSKSFYYFNDPRIFACLTQILRAMGTLTLLPSIIDFFLTYLTLSDDDDTSSSSSVVPAAPISTPIHIRGISLNAGLQQKLQEEEEEDSTHGGLSAAAAMALKELLYGAKNSTVHPQQFLNKLVVQIIESIVRLPVWQQPSSNAENAARSQFKALFSDAPIAAPRLYSVAQLSDIIYTKCALLEVLSGCGYVIGRLFRVQLLGALYPLLLALEDTHNIRIATTAHVALVHIAASCEYASLNEMLLKNVDYIIHVTSSRLRYLPHHPTVPVVLGAFVRQVGSSVVPFIGDALHDLLEALDAYHNNEYIATLILKVLKDIASVLQPDAQSVQAAVEKRQKQWTRPTNEIARFEIVKGVSKEVREFCDQIKQEQAGKQDQSHGDINEPNGLSPQQFFNQYHQQETEPSTEQDDEEEQKDNGSDNNNDGRLVHRTLARNILEHINDFVSAPSPRLRCLVLSIVDLLLPTLSQVHKDELFLPLLHRLWPVLVSRLRENDGDVRLVAFGVLQTAIKLSGDFLLRRITEELWSNIKTLLNVQTQNKFSLSSFSSEYRLLRVALATSTLLVTTQENMAPSIQRQLASIVVQYLETDRAIPVEIQRDAFTLAQALMLQNPDALWWYLKLHIDKNSSSQSLVTDAMQLFVALSA